MTSSVPFPTGRVASAEGAGFEPAGPVGPLVFKTSAIVRSAIPPAPRVAVVLCEDEGLRRAQDRPFWHRIPTQEGRDPVPERGQGRIWSLRDWIQASASAQLASASRRTRSPVSPAAG